MDVYMLGGYAFSSAYNCYYSCLEFSKEVLFSLITGVLSGAVIYSIASGMNPIVGSVSTVFDVMIQKTDMNIIIFCFFIRQLIYVVKYFWRSSSLWKMGIKNHSGSKRSLYYYLPACLVV